MSSKAAGSKREVSASSQTSSPALNPQSSRTGKPISAESHHKQFVLLQPKKPAQTRNPSTSNVPTSPRVASTSDAKKKKLQKMPLGQGKSRFIFSVDDGEDEIEQDLEREYLEGYNDALRGKLRKKLSKNPIGLVSPKQEFVGDGSGKNNQLSSSILNINKNISDIENSIAQNLIKAEEGLKDLEAKEDDLNHHLEHSFNENDGASFQTKLQSDYQRFAQQQQEDASVISTHEPGIAGEASQYGGNDAKYGETHEEEDDSGTVNDGAVDQNSHDDSESVSSIESFTLRERQDAINTTHPFGIRIWKPAIYKKFRSVQKEADMDIHEEENAPRRVHISVYIGNFVWALTFGLIGFLVCMMGSLFLIVCFSWTKGSLQYARIFWKLGLYLLYPFGKIVYLYKDKNYLDEDFNEGSSINEYRRWFDNDQEASFFFTADSSNENRPLLPTSSGTATPGHSSYHATNNADTDNSESNTKIRLFGRGQWNIGRICFFLYFYLALQPVLFVISAICWLFVFTIPMSKVTTLLCSHLRQRPLSIFFKSDRNTKISSKDASVLVSTYRACGLHYYKYTVDGTNIIILNLMAMVLFVIFDFYVLKEFLEIEKLVTDSLLIFVLCLLSIIPLAYFIGQAVASISAQSSMGVGAVINAFFSTIVEIFLYCVALNQEKGLLVEGSMIGSVLGAVLLLPGLSMCAGAIKRKTQRYNPRSAGVSSTMLLFSTVVMFSPTIFHQIFGAYEVTCRPCEGVLANEMIEPVTLQSLAKVLTTSFLNLDESSCQKCHISQPPLKADKLYMKVLKPFSIFAVLVLFFSYGIALWFTLRTHAALIWQTPIASEARQPNVSNHPSGSAPGSSLLQPVKAPKASGLKSPSLLSLSDSNMGGINSASIYSRPQMSRRVSSAVNSKARKPQHDHLVPPTEPQSPHINPSVGDATPVSVYPQSRPAQPVPPVEEAGGHDAPNWSRTKSSIILLGATVLYAVIAEILVDCVDVVLKLFPINAKFLGLTVFALVPNTTEFLNAISFAMYGNVALSMEIGSAYVLQVLQLQIPALVIFSMWRLSSVPLNKLGDWDLNRNMLTLIFSRWDCIASVISVFIFTYIYAEGKSNYFKGSLLILLYLVVMLGFYYSGEVDPNSFVN